MNMLNISWNTWMTAWASLLWRPSFRCSTIWPTFSRSKTNHRIFRENAALPAIYAGMQIDKKRRRRLQEKRMAMGHKADDHEPEMQL